MRVSGLYKQHSDDDSVPVTRIAAWALLAILLIGGGALYFIFERGIASIL